jgi:hypothetical protein
MVNKEFVKNLNLYLSYLFELKHVQNSSQLKNEYWIDMFNKSGGIQGLRKEISIAMILIHPEFPFVENTIRSKTGFYSTSSSVCEIFKIIPGAKCSNIPTQVDHLWPFSHGGVNSDLNRADLCESCNRGKSNSVGYFYWDGEAPEWVLLEIDKIRRRIGV